MTFSSRVRFFLFLFCVWARALYSQNVVVQPDCVSNVTFTAAGNIQQFKNVGVFCVNWTFSYSNNGFSALNVIVETAPGSTTTPGSWSTFGSATTGSNPNTATTSAVTTWTGQYFPWMRVRLASKTGTGTLTGILYGYKNGTARNGGGGGGTPGGVDGDIQFNNAGAFGGETLVPIIHGGTGTATPSLLAGAGCAVFGSWPNQTISCSPSGTGGTAFQYFPAASVKIATQGLSTFNTAVTSTTITNNPSGVGTNPVGLAQFDPTGASAVITAKLPLTWSSGAVTFAVDVIFTALTTGDVTITPYSACLSAGDNPNAVTWDTGTPVTVTSPGGVTPLGTFHLQIPTTSCSPDNFLFIGLTRGSMDTFIDPIYPLGALLGIPITPSESAYTTVQSAGSAVTQRSILNFVDGGCVDNAGASRTDCTTSTVSAANSCLSIGADCYFGTRFVQATLPSAISFSWQNQGSASVVTNANGTMTMTTPAQASDSLHIRYVAIPTAPYTVTGCMAGTFAQTNSAGVGLALSDGTGIITLAVGFDSTVNATGTIQSLKFTNATTFNSVYLNSPWVNSTQNIACLRFVDDNAGNRLSYYSADGQNFFLFLSSASTDFITPTRVGWFYNETNDTGGTNTLISWTSTTP